MKLALRATTFLFSSRRPSKLGSLENKKASRRRREASFSVGVAALEPLSQLNYILSKIIKDYGSLEDVANRSSEATRKHLSILTEKENEIVAKLSKIPDSVNIKHVYGVDLKSTPVIIIMILFSVIISLGLGMLLEKDRQIGDKTSYELRYRMMTLEMPDITAHIDSAYSLNSDKFHDLVIKREEENKLLYSIDRRREEIKKLKEVE